MVVITDPSDYSIVMQELEDRGDVSYETRKSLAIKAFAVTSRYDSVISNYLDGSKTPQYFLVAGKKFLDLRYGENPHQSASAYITRGNSILMANQIQGKELSYNNILDLDIAWNLVRSFDKPYV